MKCFIETNYCYKGNFHKDFIKNLSRSGAYIQSSRLLEAGEKIVMTFENPFFSNPVKTAAEIVWSASDGFGVKFP